MSALAAGDHSAIPCLCLFPPQRRPRLPHVRTLDSLRNGTRASCAVVELVLNEFTPATVYCHSAEARDDFMNRRLCLAVTMTALTAAQDKPARDVTRGPVRGGLLLQGGVGPNPAIDEAFLSLAGGPTSHIIVIPTASVGDAGPPGMDSFLARRNQQRFGVAAVTVLHSLSRSTSDSDHFVDALRQATGVWILGGFPGRLVESYLGTRTERAIRELLDRGGVVGGESAGAMIQASWLDTADEEFTPGMRALIRTHGRGGFGLLTHAAIFPHLDKRGSEAAVKFSTENPGQLGIGIDEQTALVVQGTTARVVGNGAVHLYRGGRPAVLRSGARVDLGAARLVISSSAGQNQL